MPSVGAAPSGGSAALLIIKYLLAPVPIKEPLILVLVGVSEMGLFGAAGVVQAGIAKVVALFGVG